MSAAICFNLDKSKILSSGNELTTLGKTAFKNIVGKRENGKTSIFSFFCDVSYLIKDRNYHSSYKKILTANALYLAFQFLALPIHQRIKI